MYREKNKKIKHIYDNCKEGIKIKKENRIEIPFEEKKNFELCEHCKKQYYKNKTERIQSEADGAIAVLKKGATQKQIEIAKKMFKKVVIEGAENEFL